MWHHGFRSKEARRARKLRYRVHLTTSHSTLLVDRQCDVSRKLNQTFLLVDLHNFNFVDEECSDIGNVKHGTAYYKEQETIGFVNEKHCCYYVGKIKIQDKVPV